MATRPTWKGLLQIRLVRIPIKVFPATESGNALSFNQLHAPCHTRLQQRKWCPTCDHAVLSSEIVRGFEFEPGRYVLVLDEELEAVRPASTRVIELAHFAPVAALDPVAVDRSYYVAPDGPHAVEPFAVLGAALAGHVGIGKVALYGREYLVAVRPPLLQPQPGPCPLLLHTLHHEAEIRSLVDLWADLPTAERVPMNQVRLAKQVIAACARPLDLTVFIDQYREDLQRVIDAKIAGAEVVVPPPVLDAGGDLTFTAMLEQSLQAGSANKKPARAAAAPRRKRA